MATIPALAGSWAEYPRKIREMHNHHFDSTIWNDFAFRSDDVVVATYAKSGTTWAQQIVGQMLFGGDPELCIGDLSPWLDLRVPPAAEKLGAVAAQTHRRFLKTHLPVDALVFSEQAKYIYVGRDGRDVLWSLHNHHLNATAAWFEVLNDTPGRVGPPIPQADPDIRAYFCGWLETGGGPFWPFWENVRSWWAVRHLPNVHFVHFEALKRDMAGEMRRIADFLEIEVDPARWPAIVEYCGFDWMKANAARVAPAAGAFWEGGAETFIHKGINGRWRDVLSVREIAEYEARALLELGPDCAHWLATGDPA
ncbi:sulfotransferase domain-containing protein [Sphingomonas sp. AOB5]|uniref:sulfotransferase domain-containing protein n=1 Tax=Sphingomonas sp. AOB5 TaxID=3034017 RepID=UPI0023F7965C|nr:sulfotransferase domain-containing protein [Sphingomonas sp. AOB5]MDF7776907.1 sulfotransferase domain-containing protein [Sphingomonas sp. AOB5]